MNFKKRFLTEFSVVDAPSSSEIALDGDWDASCINRDFKPFINKPVDDDILNKHSKSLVAFSEKAFVFFLKDYILYAVNHPSSELTEYLIYRLSDLDSSKSYWNTRIKLMSEAQLLLIIEALMTIKNSLNSREDFLRNKVDEAITLWSAEVENRKINDDTHQS